MKNQKKMAAGGANIAKRLGAYSAAAAATAAVVHNSANAAEVVWDIADVTAGNYPGLLFNLINGSTALATASTGNTGDGLFRMASYASFPYIAGPASSAMAGFVGPGGFGTADFYPSRLNASDTVGPLKNFGAENDALQYGPYGYLNANFTNTTGFVGLQFKIGGSLHYGWAQVTHLGAGKGTILHGFGYNDEAGEASHPVGTTVDAPVITSVEVSGDDLIIGFKGVDGMTYKLLESPDLVTGFSPTGVTGTTTAGEGTVTYVGGAAAGKNFIRLATD